VILNKLEAGINLRFTIKKVKKKKRWKKSKN